MLLTNIVRLISFSKMKVWIYCSMDSTVCNLRIAMFPIHQNASIWKKTKCSTVKATPVACIRNNCYRLELHKLLAHTVWEPLTELSNLFRDFSATMLRDVDMTKYNESIAFTLYKHGMIFSSSFFDSMDHPLIHLAYKVLVA